MGSNPGHGKVVFFLGFFFKYGPSSASFLIYSFQGFFASMITTAQFDNQRTFPHQLRLASLPGLSQQREGVLGRYHRCFLAILNKSGRLPSHADNPVDTMLL